MSDMGNDKTALRRQLKEKRDAITPEQKLPAERSIADRLTDLCHTHDVRQVFIYFNYGSELDLASLREKLPALTFAYPRLDLTGPSDMAFYSWSEGQPLIENKYGIPEPDPRSARVVEPHERTLMVVPALAVNSDGFRLGYGGGYYDRYLSRYPATKTAVAILDDFVLDDLPAEVFPANRPIGIAVDISGDQEQFLEATAGQLLSIDKQLTPKLNFVLVIAGRSHD